MVNAIAPYREHLQYVSAVWPAHAELDPGVVGQIRSHPAVARTISAIPLGVQMVVPPGGGTGVRVYGVSEADLPVLLESFGLQIQEGRLPRPRSNEIVLSAAIVANRGLRVGDVIGGEMDDDNALIVDSLPTEMVVAGILAPDRPWVGFASYEFLQSHELTASYSPLLLAIPREGQKQALDRWLEGSLDATLARVVTHDAREREDREDTTSIVLTFALLECMVAAVAAIALATLNHIFFDQRREEFGILNAVGHSRRRLVWRTVRETSSVVGAAWFAGAGLCGICLLAMQGLVYGPHGLTLSFLDPRPWLLTLPIPLAVILASVGTIAWALSRLDPVAVIEKR
jgi:hypothetical protein